MVQFHPLSEKDGRLGLEVEFLSYEQIELPNFGIGACLSFSNDSLSNISWTKTAEAVSLTKFTILLVQHVLHEPKGIRSLVYIKKSAMKDYLTSGITYS